MPCHAAYMREYRRTVASRAVRSARREGGERFRARVVRDFQKLDDREMNGLTVAAIVGRMEI